MREEETEAASTSAAASSTWRVHVPPGYTHLGAAAAARSDGATGGASLVLAGYVPAPTTRRDDEDGQRAPVGEEGGDPASGAPGEGDDESSRRLSGDDGPTAAEGSGRGRVGEDASCRRNPVTAWHAPPPSRLRTSSTAAPSGEAPAACTKPPDAAAPIDKRAPHGENGAMEGASGRSEGEDVADDRCDYGGAEVDTSWAAALLDAAGEQLVRHPRRRRRGKKRKAAAAAEGDALPGGEGTYIGGSGIGGDGDVCDASDASRSDELQTRTVARSVLGDVTALAMLARQAAGTPGSDPVAAWLVPGESRARAHLAGPTPEDILGHTPPSRLVATRLPHPAVLVGYQADWLRVAAPALRLWDKAPFEPYSGRTRDVAYVVLSPATARRAAEETLREVSAEYELCGLGKHRPLDAGDGGWFVYDGWSSGGGARGEGGGDRSCSGYFRTRRDATLALAAAVRELRRPTSVVTYVVAAARGGGDAGGGVQGGAAWRASTRGVVVARDGHGRDDVDVEQKEADRALAALLSTVAGVADVVASYHKAIAVAAASERAGSDEGGWAYLWRETLWGSVSVQLLTPGLLGRARLTSELVRGLTFAVFARASRPQLPNHFRRVGEGGRLGGADAGGNAGGSSDGEATTPEGDHLGGGGGGGHEAEVEGVREGGGGTEAVDWRRASVVAAAVMGASRAAVASRSFGRTVGDDAATIHPSARLGAPATPARSSLHRTSTGGASGTNPTSGAAVEESSDDERSGSGAFESFRSRLPGFEPLCVLDARQEDVARAPTRAGPKVVLGATASQGAGGKPGIGARARVGAAAFRPSTGSSGNLQRFAASRGYREGRESALGRSGSPRFDSPRGSPPPASPRLDSPREGTPAAGAPGEDPEVAATRSRAPGLHCCYTVTGGSQRLHDGKTESGRWLVAAWTDTVGELLALEARPLERAADEEDASEAAGCSEGLRRALSWLVRRCHVVANQLVDAAGDDTPDEEEEEEENDDDAAAGTSGDVFARDAAMPASTTAYRHVSLTRLGRLPRGEREHLIATTRRRLAMHARSTTTTTTEAPRRSPLRRLQRVTLGEMQAVEGLSLPDALEEAATPGSTIIVSLAADSDTETTPRGGGGDDEGGGGAAAAAAAVHVPNALSWDLTAPTDHDQPGVGSTAANRQVVSALSVRVLDQLGRQTVGRQPEPGTSAGSARAHPSPGEAARDLVRWYARLAAMAAATAAAEGASGGALLPPHAAAAARFAALLEQTEALAAAPRDSTST